MESSALPSNIIVALQLTTVKLKCITIYRYRCLPVVPANIVVFTNKKKWCSFQRKAKVKLWYPEFFMNSLCFHWSTFVFFSDRPEYQKLLVTWQLSSTGKHSFCLAPMRGDERKLYWAVLLSCRLMAVTNGTAFWKSTHCWGWTAASSNLLWLLQLSKSPSAQVALVPV